MDTVRVVGAAIVRDGLVLAALRGSGMSHPGVWEFPGGKVEDGEDAAAALAREIAEELGVAITVGAHLARGEALVGERRILLDVYRCTIVKGAPQAREHAELRWVALDALDELQWAEADLPALRALAPAT